jgi:hypothetical protein
MSAVKEWSARNWFLLLLPALLGAAFLLAKTAPADPALERVFLFDALVTVPFLYFLCYRGTLGRWQMALRLLALACAGIWAAGRLVPDETQAILPQLGWARALGLAVIALFEVRLLVLAVRLAFSGRADAEALAAATGAPPILARLMLLEARFWRWVWRLISRR